MNINNLNITQAVSAIIAVVFGLAAAALFLLLGIRGTLSPEFLGAIIGGVAVGAFHAMGIVIGAVTNSTGSTQGASQALSVQALPGVQSQVVQQTPPSTTTSGTVNTGV